jgi:hypothetical protein
MTSMPPILGSTGRSFIVSTINERQDNVEKPVHKLSCLLYVGCTCEVKAELEALKELQNKTKNYITELEEEVYRDTDQ